MKKLLSLGGITLLTKDEQKNLIGGAIDFLVYDSDDPCPRRHGSGSLGKTKGPAKVPGGCTNGFCA